MKRSHSFRYRVVDVFTDRPLEGNALAVFPEASGLYDDAMQKIARELNLSETTFVFPATRSDCAAYVRIFTPAKEMIFAGHPTVGTSFVLIEEGRVPPNTTDFLLEEKVGPVPIHVEEGQRPLIWLRTPPIEFRGSYDRVACADALGLREDDLLGVTPRLVSAGNPTIFVALKDKEIVDRAFLDLRGLKTLKGTTRYPCASSCSRQLQRGPIRGCLLRSTG